MNTKAIDAFISVMLQATSCDSALARQKPKKFAPLRFSYSSPVNEFNDLNSPDMYSTADSTISGLFKRVTPECDTPTPTSLGLETVSLFSKAQCDEMELSRRITEATDKAKLMLMITDFMESACYWKLRYKELKQTSSFKSISFNSPVEPRSRSATFVVEKNSGYFDHGRTRGKSFNVNSDSQSLMKKIGSLLKEVDLLDSELKSVNSTLNSLASKSTKYELKLKEAISALQIIRNAAYDSDIESVQQLCDQQLQLLVDNNDCLPPSTSPGSLTENSVPTTSSSSSPEPFISKISKMNVITRDALLTEIRNSKGKPARKVSGANTFPQLKPSFSKVRDIQETLKDALERHRAALDLNNFDGFDSTDEDWETPIY
jgi:hypothetical protein